MIWTVMRPWLLAAALVLPAAPLQAKPVDIPPLPDNYFGLDGQRPSGLGLSPHQLDRVWDRPCDVNCTTARMLLQTAERAEKVVDERLGSGTQMETCSQLGLALHSYTQAAAYEATEASADAKRVSERIRRQCPAYWPRLSEHQQIVEIDPQHQGQRPQLRC